MGVMTYEQKGRSTACTCVQYWASLSINVQQSSKSSVEFQANVQFKDS